MSQAILAPVSSSDHAALADFLASFPGLQGERDFWLSRMRLWWQDNPAFVNAPAGWVLRSGNAIEGFLGNLPSLLQCNGRCLTVHSITTWMVSPKFREQSLSLLLEHIRASEQTLLFDTTPTADVAAILESLGFVPLPWAGERESFIMADPKRCIEAALPGPLKPLARAGAAALAPLQSLRLKALRDRGLPLSAEAHEVGAEFDHLWDRTKNLYLNTNIRTSEAVRWHCLADPFIPKKLFVCKQDDRLAGYMIFKARARRGLTSLDCADFWEDPSGRGILESLIAAAREHAQNQGADLLTFPHFNRGLGDRLGRAGLLERASGRRALFLGAPKLLETIKAENSYLVGLQGDYGTAG
ncbi:MAG TPA: hypothetical protein DEB40_04785 [Elusimicrobia bacterium]|nr:hypothetical protein [Elusimicrobiota bacterium]HBT61039.1 hypothetical protein [Elusimicrobiota bacterium]